MKVHILTDEKMRKLGFTDRLKNTWYYCRMIESEVSFNLSINKTTGEFKIDVLDEDFLQPYDYQYYLSKNPNFEFALRVKEGVEKQMLYLVKEGVISEYEVGDYI